MTTSTSSASATGLPASVYAKTPRRGFLRGLATLPLIGGSIKLLGQPTAVAEPVTPDLIEGYKTWLALELRFLTWEMADDPFFVRSYGNCFGANADRIARSGKIGAYEWCVGDSAKSHEAPYSRAALVMSAVGCDWRDRERIFNWREA